MFELLTQALLWILIGVLAWFVLLRLVPPIYYTWLGGLIFGLFLILAFLNPSRGLVSEVWSLLSLPFTPLGLSIILLLSSLSEWRKRVSATLVFTAVLILIISSTPVIAYWLTQRVESAAAQVDAQTRNFCQGVCPAEIPPASQQAVDAIVLLGWGTTQPALPYRTRIQLTDSGDRVLFAVQLYREQLSQGRNPFVIVSAGPRSDLAGDARVSRDIIEANTIETVLIEAGVPRDRIVLEPTATDVRSSAVAVERLLREQRIGSRIFLISSALETNRASRAFGRLGLRVIPRPTNFYTIQVGGVTPTRRFRVEDFLPSAEALVITTRVVQEYLLSIFYFIRGWLAPLGL